MVFLLLFYEVFPHKWIILYLSSYNTSQIVYQALSSFENQWSIWGRHISLKWQPSVLVWDDYNKVYLTEFVKEGSKEIEGGFSDYPWVNDFIVICLGFYEKHGS